MYKISCINKNFLYNKSMFNSLYGTITEKLPQTIYIETNGIEWDLSVPDSALESFPPVGSQARIYTWLQHREDIMKLYGFPSVEDRSLFLDLLKVDGVGSRAALKIMSNISSKQLSQILDNEDIGQLEKLPGVGKKTAQKMMLALKGKLTFSANTQTQTNRQINSKWQDVISALIDMGYDKRLCEETIEKLSQSLSTELEGKNKVKQEEIMFSRAIVELA